MKGCPLTWDTQILAHVNGSSGISAAATCSTGDTSTKSSARSWRRIARRTGSAGPVSHRTRHSDPISVRSPLAGVRRRLCARALYRHVDALGSGSMGTVYRAQCKNDGQWYAVRGLAAARVGTSAWPGASACSKSASTRPLCPLSTWGTSGGMHYLAWPLVDGMTLDKIVTSSNKLAAVVAQYATKVAEGLGSSQQGTVPRANQAVEYHDRQSGRSVHSRPGNRIFCLRNPRENRWSTPCRRPTRW